MFPNIQGRCKCKKRIILMKSKSMIPAHCIIPYGFLSIRVAEALGMSWKLNTEIRGKTREGLQRNLSKKTVEGQLQSVRPIGTPVLRQDLFRFLFYPLLKTTSSRYSPLCLGHVSLPGVNWLK